MKPRLFIGLMSGTSVDAIDAAIVEIRTPIRAATVRERPVSDAKASRSLPNGRGSDGYHVRVVAHHEERWPTKLRQRLLDVMAPATVTTAEICELNVLVANAFATTTINALKKAKLFDVDITALGSHGQTVCHLPPGKTRKVGSTLQLGDVSVLATMTGIRTVGNFRPADVAAGGQGAPLVPLADAMMLRDKKKSRAVQNIGGIANVTYLPAGKSTSDADVIAFDTGPGNMVIDAMVSHHTGGKMRFDRGGKLGRKGAVNLRLFRELQGHPYFEQALPKSTGRELFGAGVAVKLYREWVGTRKTPFEDLLHTATRWTAWSIADSYLRYLPERPDEIIVCGGGADNPLLMEMLSEELSHAANREVGLRRIDEFGVPNKAKEAAAFAILAAATLDGQPGNLPSVTGANRPVVLGTVSA